MAPTGRTITLSGGNAVRLFTVTAGGLTVQNVALVNGHDTAGLPGGAAIAASAPVIVTNSTVSGHQTTSGGCSAIVVSGTSLALTGTTVTGNVNGAPATGDAICGNNTSNITITNSTISGNTGGALFTSGSATFTNSTVASNAPTGLGNSGGITSFAGTIMLQNTIIAKNTGTGQCAAVVGGVITDGGGNLQSPDNGCGLTIPVGNPLLGALTNNGGPTRTMALITGSAALGIAVHANCPATDQRGVARGAVTCDAGAFEGQVAVSNPVPTPTLSDTALVALALLSALVGMAALRRRYGRSS